MSLTGPDILRIACGDASASESSPRRGDSAYKEFEFLRTTWEAVQLVRPPSPKDESVDMVHRDAEAVGTRDARGPANDVLLAILAEARAMSALTTVASQAPVDQPSREAVSSVLEMARLVHMGSEPEFAAIRAALGEADVPEKGTPVYAEYEILKQALDATRRLPATSPRAETILSVETAAGAIHTVETERAAALMRGALGEEVVLDEAQAEVEGLRSTLRATARLPRPSPSEESIAAVLAEVKRHERVPVGMLPAQDRAASGPSVAAPRFVWQRWAGVAVVLLASTVALLVTRPWSLDSPENAQVASVERLGETDLPNEQSASEADLAEPESSSGAPTQQDVVQVEAPSGPQAPPDEADTAGDPPRKPDSTPASAPAEVQGALATVSPRPSGVAPADLEPVDAPGEPPANDATVAPDVDVAWEAGEDVRALSLRLQQLREQNRGLNWGGPTVALGTQEGVAATNPAIQTVGVGAIRVGTAEIDGITAPAE